MSKALKSAGMGDAAIARVRADAARVDAWLDQAAELLYEGGAMPPWQTMRDFIARWTMKGARPGQSTRDRLSFYRDIVDRHRHQAQILRGLAPAAAHEMAALLLTMARDRQADQELQLWRRVERAEGKPAGTLTRPLGERGGIEETALIVYGPPGSGKTRNALGLMAHFGKTILIEADDDDRYGLLTDPTKLPPRALVLTVRPIEGGLPIATALQLAGIVPREQAGAA